MYESDLVLLIKISICGAATSIYEFEECSSYEEWILQNILFAKSDLLNSQVRMLRVMWQIFISHIISGVVLPFPVHTGVQERV